MTKKKGTRTSIGDLVGALGRRAPFDLAEEWDNVGFLAGDAADELKGVVVTVNLGPEALAAAEKAGANAIVCHHPPIFKPVSKVTRSSSPYLYEALRRGIGVVALHTNFDLSSEPLSRELSATLGFPFKDFLAPRGGSALPRSARLGKFVTFVPEDKLDVVREAVCRAGAGRIGEYTQCSFSTEGEGTFFGGEAASPKTGKAGRLERVRERKLEVVFAWKSLADVIAAARAAHPYEEMAYDVLELAQPSRALGYGFVGEPGGRPTGHLAFDKVLDNVKETFQLRSVTVAGPGMSKPDMKVGRLAFSPGSGSSFVGAACAKGVDVYLCGEVGYHQMLEARQKGLTLVLLGHGYSERFFVETVAGWCESEAAAPVKKIFETVHENF
ncbi:MAG: Nif3-like dinuclear metal center hexameric protein [Deltaproteobacteria bacterium]|nr:Nif3-like dinuclear metal center hexameric protein [Deltaproteobacteria bacterium]